MAEPQERGAQTPAAGRGVETPAPPAATDYQAVVEYEPVDAALQPGHPGQSVALGLGASTPVLMSAQHDEGWKLEVLLLQVDRELATKNAKLAKVPGEVAARVHANNDAIRAMLRTCRLLQEQSLHTLDTLGPNQGPGGTPRV